MKNKLTVVIRFFCISGFSLVVWPLFYAATSLGLVGTVATAVKNAQYVEYTAMKIVFRDAQAAPALWCLFFAVLSSWVGAGTYWLKCYIQKKNVNEKNSIIILSNVFTFLLPAAVIALGAVLFFRLELYWVMGIIGAVFTAAYGYRNIQRPYGDVLTSRVLLATVGVTIAGMLLFYGLKVSYNAAWFVWPFFAEALLCAVSQNQGNLDFLMARRKHDLSHLPKKVRRYSLTLTGVILTLMLLVILFRVQIGKAFAVLVELLRQIGRAVLMGIIWFMNLFSNEDVKPEEGGSAQSTHNQTWMGGDAGSPWWDYIMYTLLAAIALFLLIHYRREIMRAVRQFFRKISSFIREKLLSAPVLRQFAAADQSEYYTDQTEILPPEEWKEEEHLFHLREWKKEVRQFMAMPPSPEKYRRGYGLGIRWLCWKGVDIQPADTPEGIRQKAQKTLPQAQWEDVTRFYQLVRYREEREVNPAALGELTELIGKMGK